jgi:hypothetical protein
MCHFNGAMRVCLIIPAGSKQATAGGKIKSPKSIISKVMSSVREVKELISRSSTQCTKRHSPKRQQGVVCVYIFFFLIPTSALAQ